MRLDRNQFLLLAGAIGTATATVGWKQDQQEEDQARGCDDDTGQSGWSKYCPIAEGQHKGCLDSSSCMESGLKAASELRYFDCLANAPLSTCSSETALAQLRCGQQVVNHACPDPTVAQVCQRARRTCASVHTTQLQSCEIYLTPLTSAGRAQVLSCMVEGSCTDSELKSCLPYLR